MDVYVMKNGTRQGPFLPFRLTEMLEDGSLVPQDLVWHDGMEKWKPLGEAESLRTVLKSPAPVTQESPPGIEDADQSADPPPIPRQRDLPLSQGSALQIARERRRLAWRRFFARQIDFGIAAGIAIGGTVATGLGSAWELLSGFGPVAITFGWMFMEAVLLSTTGSTPGRDMLGIRVFHGETEKPSFLTALKRSALVLAAGLGLGLPYMPLIIAQWMFSFWQFNRLGTTLWDRACGTRVAYHKLTLIHGGAIATFMAALFALTFWMQYYAPLPQNMSPELRKGMEQARKEFFENINQRKQG